MLLPYNLLTDDGLGIGDDTEEEEDKKEEELGDVDENDASGDESVSW